MEPNTSPNLSRHERLARQVAFLMEADKLKTVLRRNRVVSDPQRHENDAEHMYHFALFAMVLAEYANAPVNLLHVLRMILIHDVVEIDAGDTFVYDMAAQTDKREREERAADRLFNLLPADQAAEYRELWEEFEAEETVEARFAAALDRMQPLLCNYFTGGGAWKEHHVTPPQVFGRNRKMERGSTELWAYVSKLLDDAVTKGYMAPTAVQTGSESTS